MRKVDIIKFIICFMFSYLFVFVMFLLTLGTTLQLFLSVEIVNEIMKINIITVIVVFPILLYNFYKEFKRDVNELERKLDDKV